MALKLSSVSIYLIPKSMLHAIALCHQVGLEIGPGTQSCWVIPDLTKGLMEHHVLLQRTLQSGCSVTDLTSSARQTVQPSSIPDPNCFLWVLCVWISVLGPWFLMFQIMTVPPPKPSIPRSHEVSTNISLRIQTQLAAAKLPHKLVR